MLYILDDLIIDRPWKLWNAYLDKQIMLAVRFVNLLKEHIDIFCMLIDLRDFCSFWEYK